MFSPPLYFISEAGQNLIDEGEAMVRKRMAELEGQLRAAMHGRATEIEWRSALELPARYVARQSRAADLVIVGGGGNALLNPFAGAWKDCTEARRVVADALLLVRTKEVTIAGIAEEEGGQAAVRRQVEDVAKWLSRHGVEARVQVPERTGNALVQLERIAADIGPGLIVAGAYGRSRFREWVLGGVTAHLLGQPARCVLLSR